MLYGIQYYNDTDFDIETIFDEVCRRYAEEMMYTRLANKPIIKTLNEQISQLKKQLEEADQAMNDLMRAGNKTIANLKSKIEEKDFELNNYQTALTICQERESKLEVKEKPDLLKLFKKHCRMNWEWEWVEDHGAINFNEFKKAIESVIMPRDAAIAERDEKIKELEKDFETERTTGRQEWERLQLDKVLKLESELNQAKELLTASYMRIEKLQPCSEVGKLIFEFLSLTHSIK